MAKFKVNAEIVKELNLPGKLAETEFTLMRRSSFREYEYIERISKIPYDNWSSLMSTKALFFLSIRHVDHELVTWDQFADLAPVDFEETEADPEDEVDPAADPTGGEPAPA